MHQPIALPFQPVLLLSAITVAHMWSDHGEKIATVQPGSAAGGAAPSAVFREDPVVGIRVGDYTEGELLQVGETLHVPCFAPGFLQRGEEQRGQYRDDCNNDKKFY